MFGAVKKTTVRTPRPDKPVETESYGLGEAIMEIHHYFPGMTRHEIMKLPFPLLREYAREAEYQFHRELFFAQLGAIGAATKML